MVGDVGLDRCVGTMWAGLDASGAEDPLSPVTVAGCQRIQVGRR